jgi:outer membrane PBP1 activator LpoA protein
VCINFCDIPWFLESQAGLKLSIDKAWPTETDRYGRLFAMGTDALQLAGRLRMLEAIPGSKVYGATGALSLRSNRTIQRQLQWATFVEGLPVMRHHLNTPKS